MREIGVGLLGLGNVGAGVVNILRSHAREIEARLGAQVVVRRVAIRDQDKPRAASVDRALLTTSIEQVLDDPQVAIVVEVMGGVDLAARWVLAALDRGKHVVTANKALLAERGDEVFAKARARGVDVYYEAAVCGGLPILRTIREALAADRISAIYGIVNGTTNFILTRMTEERAPFSEALAAAQAVGYAEADPSLDIGGGDAAQKLCILAALAFGTRVHPADVFTEGIGAIEPIDLAQAREFGYCVKLLATAKRVGEGVETHVCPVLLPLANPLASVRGPYNAVLLVADALGPALFQGQGAGGAPTGSAVVGDIIDCSRNIVAGAAGRVPMPYEPNLKEVAKLPMSESLFPYYLRVMVDDRPGVLARICGVLGERGISIGAVTQKERGGVGQGPVPVTIVTHEAREGDVQTALSSIEALPSTRGKVRLLRIENRLPMA
jgi:homoserine dehydrogenase